MGGLMERALMVGAALGVLAFVAYVPVDESAKDTLQTLAVALLGVATPMLGEVVQGAKRRLGIEGWEKPRGGK